MKSQIKGNQELNELSKKQRMNSKQVPIKMKNKLANYKLKVNQLLDQIPKKMNLKEKEKMIQNNINERTQ